MPESSGYKVGQILYRATVRPGSGWLRTAPDAAIPVEDPNIWYDEFVVMQVTQKGAWVVHGSQIYLPFDRKKNGRWVSFGGRFCSPTKEDAVTRLRARTVAYVRHARRRLRDAEERAKVLGLTNIIDRPKISLFDTEY